MMNSIRQWRVVGRQFRIWIEADGAIRPRRRRAGYGLAGWESLEQRELLSTTQDFSGASGQTSYSLDQIGGAPAAQVITGGPTGHYLQRATTPATPTLPTNNSISFVTSDPGTWEQAMATWDFSVTPSATGQDGVGMSFALLNTADYGTSGNASSTTPQDGTYNGSLAFGFDTTDDIVNIGLNNAVVTNANLTGTLNLASGVYIQATAVVNFPAATVSLTLTPTGGTAVTVFNSVSVPGLSGYESRVSLQAMNSTTSVANFNVDSVNVVYSGALSAGTVEFGTVPSVPENIATGLAPVPIVRQVASGFTATGAFSVLVTAANGSAQNGVNYLAEIVQQQSDGTFVIDPIVSFAATDTEKIVYIPVLDDHLYDGNKTVNLYLSNTTNFTSSNPILAPLGSPIVTTLTILNTDSPPPTVSHKVQLIYVPGTRRVEAFRLQFSEAMDPVSSQSLSSYEVLLPPAHKRGASRSVSLAQAVLDPSGLFVTLYRASLGQHLTKYVKIIVRGKPTTGLLSADGTYLAGTGGVSGTDASIIIRV